ncbi:tol-pal system protein YbgF [Planktotalea sp.]|uniref:tol-pal system protein YbgF n=1 Tax=Planktotalea sp. TaxID=2029877 RepID=UPI003D6A8D23
MRNRVTQQFLAAALALSLVPFSAQGQASRDQTLADIRQDMSILFVEMQRLKRELSTTGSSAAAIGGTSVTDRITSVEGELQRLTGKIEQLEFRIDSIVKDGTNRIGDLEFRLVELEGGDVSKLGQTSTLGGGAEPTNVAAPVPSTGTETGGAQLAMGEQADFDSAEALLKSGDGAAAAEQFALFTQNYPGSPLEGRARLKQGEAHENAGDSREAARAYLEAYSRDPSSDTAPEALFRLGRSLGRLGKISEACVTLGEVSVRYPDAAAASSAQSEMSTLNCV